MGKLSLLLLLSAVFTSAAAQQNSPADSLNNTVTRFHVPGDVTITMADGQGKKVSEIQAGEPIKCVREGLVQTSRICEVEQMTDSALWLTTLYLRPVDEAAASRSTWPLIPALMIETAPTALVTTPEGPRMISQLRKGDILYHVEPSTQQISTWKVGIVRRKSRQVSTLYSVVTEEGTYLLENLVAQDR
ncbi:hypothetical protein [Arundinibacter roseus]|uniref:Uncharacterized protein n=1 Tax=Arundinibacter roseus TaxID=2070510 RepID=A0A4R4KHB1_9BACT|nr:hypothetical protein [Arundinibacter roseus]TDB65969.1 hypothetical protein EZE20_09410 [Arundinibacter roseus]